MATTTTKAESSEVKSVVVEGSEHDVKRDGVRAVSYDTYKQVAIAGGFFNPDEEPTNTRYYPPLDISGLRTLRDDAKADAGRRQAAGSRLAEIDKILGGQ